jgi:hypothetical protein
MAPGYLQLASIFFDTTANLLILFANNSHIIKKEFLPDFFKNLKHLMVLLDLIVLELKFIFLIYKKKSIHVR